MYTLLGQNLAPGAFRAARDVIAERDRQVSDEGFTGVHDDAHTDGAMSDAAACYAYCAPLAADEDKRDYAEAMWPSTFDPAWYKPEGRRRDLVKAAALLLAEIERLDRIETRRLAADT